MVSAAIAAGDIQAVNYFIAQRYVDALTAFANSPNEKVMFMPMEAAGVMSSIAGISEIAKQAFAKRGDG